MLNKLAQFVFWLFRKTLERLPSNLAANIVGDVIENYAGSKAPKDALIFLFDLDNRLYSLQGSKSVAFGEGMHTKHRHILYHDFFVQRLKPGEKVLDIGCGIGRVAYEIAHKAGCNVIGIDLDVSKIEQAIRKHSLPNIEYIVGDVLVDLPQGIFDVVVLSNVLEHLSNRVDFLKKTASVTKAQKFLIRVPLFERDWRVPLKKELGIEWRLDRTHETEYTHESFEDEIKKAGLSILYYEVRWGEIWAEVKTHVN